MKTIILIISATLIWISSFGQDTRPIFIGFQPGITKEPFYPEKEFDINVLPLVLLKPLTNRFDFRATSLVNYHLGGNNQVSDLGIFTVWPIYFKAKESKMDRSSGIYVGPVVGLGYNLMNEHVTVTTGIEPGYIFKPSHNFTISLGVQFGMSYFKYNNGSEKWQDHWGPKINLGWWIN